LQKTIKQTFSARELKSFSRGFEFYWQWIPSEGHSGGLLIGAASDFAMVLEEN